MGCGISGRYREADRSSSTLEAPLPTLLVANSGGHLEELYELFPRMVDVDRDAVTWVTFDGAQSRSLLEGRDVVFAPYSRPRDLAATARYALLAHRVLRRRAYSHAISTGASIAVPFLSLARMRGVSSHYIESATRVHEPSRTGQLLARVPGVHLYTQMPGWADPPWHFGGSVYDRYRAVDTGRAAPIRRVAVATGSARDFGFRRLLEAVVATLPAEVEVTWQTGSTPVAGLPIDARPDIPQGELADAFARADVVVAHAGVGVSLMALAAGRCPVLVPRRAARGEHVDDHQVEIATHLERQGLAVACDADALDMGVLARAASRRIVRSEPAEPFRLIEGAAPRRRGAPSPHRHGSRGGGPGGTPATR